MSKIDAIKSGFKVIAKAAEKHMPTICIAVGVVAMGAATVKAIIEAPKAKDDLEDLETDPELSHKEYIKGKAKIIFYHYWGVAGLMFLGAGLIFWGHKISLGRTAAAIAAYQMSKDDLKKLENKVIETDGEKHLEKMQNDINADKVNAHPFNNDLVYNTGHGNTLFYDPWSGRYFLSDYEFIRQAKEDANCDISELIGKGRRAALSYDEWLEYLDLPPIDGVINGQKVGPTYGKHMGWVNRKIGLKFTSMRLGDGAHCEVLDYTKSGEPRLHMGIEDEYFDDYDYDDDSTDMPLRG